MRVFCSAAWICFKSTNTSLRRTIRCCSANSKEDARSALTGASVCRIFVSRTLGTNSTMIDWKGGAPTVRIQQCSPGLAPSKTADMLHSILRCRTPCPRRSLVSDHHGGLHPYGGLHHDQYVANSTGVIPTYDSSAQRCWRGWCCSVARPCKVCKCRQDGPDGGRDCLSGFTEGCPAVRQLRPI